MSTLQHINSVVNYNWPELSRKYPGFDKPQIVPASTLRGIAPVYLRSAIDQSEDSYFMFIAGDATKGDCSRETACQFFDELFYEKLQMPSSYEANEGYTREEAIDKEVLPPATDRQFRSFYDEQMAKVNAEQERQRRIDNLGFDPDDPDIIDVTDDGATIDGQPVNTGRAVGQAQTTAVGMPKKIFYCVDFHCPAGGMLGYNGGAGSRLGGGRGGRRFLREANANLNSQLVKIIKDMLQHGVDLKDIQVKVQGSDGKLYSKLTGCMVGWPLDSEKNCCLFYSNGPGKERTLDELLNEIKEESVKKNINRISQLIFQAYRVSDDPMTPHDDGPAKHISKIINNGKELIFVQAGSKKIKSDYDAFLAENDADPEKMMKEFVEEDEESDPEKMMKEFVEKKENGEVEEDEYRRPKNQPHNLHQVDETSSHQLSPADRDKLVKAIGQRLLTSKGLIGRRLLNPIVKKSDEEQVLVPGFGKPITKDDCLALAQNFDDWKVINHRNIDRDIPILDALERLLDPSDDKLGINVDIPDDAIEYRPHGLYEKDEDESGNEDESEELNESMVRFCDRLIRG